MQWGAGLSVGSLSTFPGLDKEFYIWEKHKTQLPGKQKAQLYPFGLRGTQSLESAEGTLGCIL